MRVRDTATPRRPLMSHGDEGGNMPALYAQESFINATEGHRFGDSPIMETYCDTAGELYREMQREYGRCTGKVYVDSEDGPIAIGWVFHSRQRYEDSGETYLREVWVTVHDAPDTVTREHHYHAIGGRP